MSDPFHLLDTREQCDYATWFFHCDRWWDEVGFEQAWDYTQYDWEQWYASGLTVEQAVRLAHRETFGSDLPA